MPNPTALPGKKTPNFLENSMAAQKSPVHFEIQISVNLSDFQQIQVKFHQLFAKVNEVKPWKSLENYQIYRSFDEREEERKKKAVFGRNSQKLTKSAKRKIGKRCSSQKRWNFMAGDERTGQTLRFEPQQAILWQIWPKSPKKCQMRKIPKKSFFQSSKKGLKRWKKWF